MTVARSLHASPPPGASDVRAALFALAFGGCVHETNAPVRGPDGSDARTTSVDVRVVVVAADAPVDAWQAAVDVAEAAIRDEVPALVLVPRWEVACPARSPLDRLAAASIPVVPPEVARTCREDPARPPRRDEGAGLVRVDRLGRVRRRLPSAGGRRTDLSGTELDAFDVLVVPDDAPARTYEPWTATSPPGAPPVVVLASSPLEAAGVRGVGGSVADATIRYAPPWLVDAYTSGRIDGIVAGGEPDLWAAADLTRATMRADRLAPPHPVFQVVVPTPRLRRRGDRLLRFRSMAVAPDALRFGPGIAVMDLDGDAFAVSLVDLDTPARASTLEVPLRAPPTGPRDFGPIHPCPRCSPVPADARP